MGWKLLGGLGVKLMTWCVTETHHLSLIHVFELQGCNVARLVCKDLFQIAVPEGSAAVHAWEVCLKKTAPFEEEAVNMKLNRKIIKMYPSTYL